MPISPFYILIHGFLVSVFFFLKQIFIRNGLWQCKVHCWCARERLCAKSIDNKNAWGHLRVSVIKALGKATCQHLGITQAMRWRQCKKVKLECCIALQVKGGGPTKGRALWLAQKGSGQAWPLWLFPSQGLRKGGEFHCLSGIWIRRRAAKIGCV